MKENDDLFPDQPGGEILEVDSFDYTNPLPQIERCGALHRVTIEIIAPIGATVEQVAEALSFALDGVSTCSADNSAMDRLMLESIEDVEATGEEKIVLWDAYGDGAPGANRMGKEIRQPIGEPLRWRYKPPQREEEGWTR